MVINVRHRLAQATASLPLLLRTPTLLAAMLAAGLAASLAATVLMLALRLVAGIVTLPEMVGERVLPLMSAGMFVQLLIQLGKISPLAYALIGQVVLGALAALLFPVLLEGVERARARRGVGGAERTADGGWPSGVEWLAAGALSLLLWLLALALFWPVLPENLYGYPEGPARFITIVGLAAIFALYGAVLALAYHALAARVAARAARGEAAPDAERRALLARSAAGLALCDARMHLERGRRPPRQQRAVARRHPGVGAGGSRRRASGGQVRLLHLCRRLPCRPGAGRAAGRRHAAGLGDERPAADGSPWLPVAHGGAGLFRRAQLEVADGHRGGGSTEERLLPIAGLVLGPAPHVKPHRQPGARGESGAGASARERDRLRRHARHPACGGEYGRRRHVARRDTHPAALATVVGALELAVDGGGAGRSCAHRAGHRRHGRGADGREARAWPRRRHRLPSGAGGGALMARLVLAAGAEARAGDTDDNGGAQPRSASHWSSLALRALSYILLTVCVRVGFRRRLAIPRP